MLKRIKRRCLLFHEACLLAIYIYPKTFEGRRVNCCTVVTHAVKVMNIFFSARIELSATVMIPLKKKRGDREELEPEDMFNGIIVSIMWTWPVVF